MALYTLQRLSQLPESASFGSVAALCRRAPGTWAEPAALLIEDWVDRYKPSVDLMRQLVDPNESNFWAAVGELMVATALDQYGFSVDMRPRLSRPGLSSLTPDIAATKSGRRIIVEVAVKKNDKKTEDERELLRQIALDLKALIDLPDGGFLALSVLPSGGVRETSRPNATELEEIADSLNRWLRSGAHGRFQYVRGRLPLKGMLTRGDRPDVAIAPRGGSLGQGVRIGRVVTEKLEKYAPFMNEDSRFTIAIVAAGWKVTENQLVTAILGGERMTLDPVTFAHLGDGYDGRGAAVVGGPFDSGHAGVLSGAWYFSGNLHEANFDGMPAYASFLHSPYSEWPISPAELGVPRQLIVRGGAVAWQGQEREGRLLLR